MLNQMYVARTLASSSGLICSNSHGEAQAQRPTSQRGMGESRSGEVVQFVPNFLARITCRSTCPRHRPPVPVYSEGSMCPRQVSSPGSSGSAKMHFFSHHFGNGNEARNRWLSRSRFSRSCSTWQRRSVSRTYVVGIRSSGFEGSVVVSGVWSPIATSGFQRMQEVLRGQSWSRVASASTTPRWDPWRQPND